MSDLLPRLKPDPIPPISPVPEYLADDRLRAVYDDTKSVLQVPWMGVVTMAFAHYPTFYGALWGGMRELVGSTQFVAACRDLRASVENAAEHLGGPSLVPALKEQGYADAELEQIRSLIEVFSHGNMPYLLIATMARLLLEGADLSGKRTCDPCPDRHGPSPSGRLILIEPHHADPTLHAVYGDIKASLGLPFVNTDYRALARWPSYFSQAWADLRPLVGTPAYDQAVTDVHHTAVDLVRTLPNPGALTPSVLQEAAARDTDPTEILEVVRLFQWLLPGLVVNVACLRQQIQIS